MCDLAPQHFLKALPIECVGAYRAPMETLRDRYGRTIAKIDAGPDGRQILRDRYGWRLGEYSPRDNVTRDKYGRRLGLGNLLVRLLED